MRRSLIFVLLVLLTLMSACGSAEPKKQADLGELYSLLTESASLPEMIDIPESRREQLLGIRGEDCTQAITMLCADSVRADEIWLIEAVDEKAAGQIEKLARQRLAQRSDEMQYYLPDQYAVLQHAELLQDGRYVALFVSPEAETMAQLFREALSG